MATATATGWETLDELVGQLGDIPLKRIRMKPFPGTATEADLLEAERRYHSLFELVDGILVEKGMGYRESLLAGFLIAALRAFVRPRNLGLVSGPDGFVRLFPGLVRAPDVAYASWDRFPDGKVPDRPVPTLAPDLVAEILSESNTAKEMGRKRGEYFSQGVSVVWEIDPETRTVMVYEPDGTATTLTESDRLDGGDVLPGFSLELRELFAELDLHR
jgi:Uma2 family endonuclease